MQLPALPLPAGATKGKDHRFTEKQITGNSCEIRKRTITAKILMGIGYRKKKTIQEKNTHHSTLNNRPPSPPSNGSILDGSLQHIFWTRRHPIFSEKSPHDMRWYRIMSESWPCPLLATTKINPVIAGTRTFST